MSTLRRRILRWALPLAILLILAAVAVAALAMDGNGDAGTDPDTGADEGEMIRSPLQIESVDVLVMESFPPQLSVQVVAIIPDGCTEALEPDVTQEGNTFTIEILGERPADMMCTQAIEYHEENIMLGTVDPGEYTINVNDVTETVQID